MNGGAAAKPLTLAGVATVGTTVVVVAMLAFAVRPFSPTNPPPPAPAAPDVQVVNYTYIPALLTVKAGTTVSWKNIDTVEHTFTVEGHAGGHTGSIDSALMGQGQKFNNTFDIPGSCEYHGDPHPTMMGTITVTAQGWTGSAQRLEGQP